MTDQEVPSSSSTQMITPEHQDGQDKGDRLAELLENGRDIRESYFQTFDPLLNRSNLYRNVGTSKETLESILKRCKLPPKPLFQPRMIPPLPKSKFVDKMDMKHVDKLKKTDKKKSGALKGLRFHSVQGYKAEVKVFRALERLKLDSEKITVLHSLKYSESDYELFTGKGKDGECDFVVMGQNYFVIIEVKNNIADRNKANIQTERTEKLIAGIIAKISDCKKNPKILKLSAYPFYSYKKSKTNTKLTEDIDITGENLIDDAGFSEWWTTQVKTPLKTQVMFSDEQYSLRDYEQTRDVLTALWATENNVCRKERCSLSWNVLDVDEKLKKGHITFEQRPKEGRDPETLRNPDIVAAPDEIRQYVGVDNLTTEQDKVFQSKQNLLFIRGPAGSGKTVLLAGKLIQLVQDNPKKKVVVFKYAGDKNNSTFYQDACNNANVEFDVLPLLPHSDYSELLQQLITNSDKSVVIAVVVKISRKSLSELSEVLPLLSNCNVIIDDLQCLFNRGVLESWPARRSSVTVLIDTLVTLSANNTVRVACDVAQHPRSDSTHVNELCSLIVGKSGKLSADQIKFLTKNLRNTYDISEILNVIRNCSIKSTYNTSNHISVRTFESFDDLMPKQVAGHFIRGTITQFHVFNNDYDENNHNMIDFVNKLINKLLMNKEFDTSKVALVCSENDHNYDGTDIILELIDSRITKCLCANSNSAEWPVVIVLHLVSDHHWLNRKFSQLYLAISRARVMCYVVLYPRIDGKDLNVFEEVLKELEPLAHVIRH